MSVQRSQLPHASISQRFKAGLIDLFLFSITLSVSKAICQLFFAKDPGSIFHFIISMSYYAIPQYLNGQSLGKRLFDLRLVRNDSNETAGFIRVVLRESIGKYISLLVFLVGYLSILFRTDRRAWHDLLCGTCVVSLTQEQEQTSFLTMFMSSVGGVTVLAGVGVYVALFTSYPLKQIAKNLESMNIQADGIRGSLLKGFSVDRISYRNKDQEIELTHFNVNYKNLYTAFETRKFEITNLSADSIKAKITKNFFNELPKTQGTKSKAVETNKKPKENPFTDLLLSEMSFKNIDIQSDVPEMNFKFSELSVHDFKLSESAAEISRIQADSSDLSLSVSNGSLDFLTQIYKLHAAGTLHPSFSKKITKNFDFNAVVEGQGPNLLKVNIAAFENRLRLYSVNNDKFVLTMSAFSPNEYIATALPIQQIDSFQIFDKSEAIFGILNLTGATDYGHVRFTFAPSGVDFVRATGSRGGETFEMNVRSLTLLTLFGVPNQPKMKLISNKALRPEDHLSRFYFNKDFAILSVDEKSFLGRQELNENMRVPAVAPGK